MCTFRFGLFQAALVSIPHQYSIHIILEFSKQIDYFDLNLTLKTQSTFAYYQITSNCYTYFTLCDV